MLICRPYDHNLALQFIPPSFRCRPLELRLMFRRWLVRRLTLWVRVRRVRSFGLSSIRTQDRKRRFPFRRLLLLLLGRLRRFRRGFPCFRSELLVWRDRDRRTAYVPRDCVSLLLLASGHWGPRRDLRHAVIYVRESLLDARSPFARQGTKLARPSRCRQRVHEGIFGRCDGHDPLRFLLLRCTLAEVQSFAGVCAKGLAEARVQGPVVRAAR